MLEGGGSEEERREKKDSYARSPPLLLFSFLSRDRSHVSAYIFCLADRFLFLLSFSLPSSFLSLIYGFQPFRFELAK